MKIQVILTHPYEGGHPDHDSASFAAQSAVVFLPLEIRPRRAEFTTYHRCPAEMVTGRFSTAAGLRGDGLSSGQSAANTKGTEACLLSDAGGRVNAIQHGGRALSASAGVRFCQTFARRRTLRRGIPWGVNADDWLKLARSAREDLRLC
jgi:hypothetical protein